MGNELDKLLSEKAVEALHKSLFAHLEPSTRPADMKTEPLTVEKLQSTFYEMKRATGHILVIEAEYLPEDCYGILYLRPEDARKFRGK